MFDKFGDYMYSLLIAPFRSVQKRQNQMYIFFAVLGKIFDRCKQDIFKVREEAMIISASEHMLDIHGADRDMARLKGETTENYRTRLLMKSLISEAAGTNDAIRYVARAFGYETTEITHGAPDKWAEVSVRFIGGKIVLDDKALLLMELNKIKPAGALMHLSKEQRFKAQANMATAYIIGKHITLRQG